MYIYIINITYIHMYIIYIYINIFIYIYILYINLALSYFRCAGHNLRTCDINQATVFFSHQHQRSYTAIR